jgi:hypothetical protein
MDFTNSAPISMFSQTQEDSSAKYNIGTMHAFVQAQSTTIKEANLFSWRSFTVILKWAQDAN